jgi:segregation and condensation protein B
VVRPAVADLPLAHRLEALLFVATEPLTANRLATATSADTQAVERALAELAGRLTAGIRLSHLNGRYRLVTAPDTAGVVREYLQAEAKADLTRPALETLAIIAYRGPLTKSAIEHIRGVASDTMLRNLLSRGLIAEAGKSSEPGRPMHYTVSHAFLQHFGLASLADLPRPPEDGPPRTDLP